MKTPTWYIQLLCGVWFWGVVGGGFGLVFGVSGGGWGFDVLGVVSGGWMVCDTCRYNGWNNPSSSPKLNPTNYTIAPTHL